MDRAKFKDIKKSGHIVLKTQLSDLILVWALIDFGKVVVSTLSIFVGGFIVYGPAKYGAYSTYLKATNGEKIHPKNALDGFKDRFGDSFLAGLIMQIVEFIPATLLGSIAIAGIAVLLSASTVFDFIDLGLGKGTMAVSIIVIIVILALDVVCIILRFAFAMTIFILTKDENISAIDAVKQSGWMMKGEKFRLLRFDISFILWFCLLPITSGFAAFYVFPYYLESKVVFLSEVYNRKKSELEKLQQEERSQIEEERREFLESDTL